MESYHIDVSGSSAGLKLPFVFTAMSIDLDIRSIVYSDGFGIPSVLSLKREISLIDIVRENNFSYSFIILTQAENISLLSSDNLIVMTVSSANIVVSYKLNSLEHEINNSNNTVRHNINFLIIYTSQVSA